jgi:alpha-L-fucosidase 2
MSTGTRLHAKALFLLVLLIGLGTSLPTESGESAQSAEGSNLKLWYSRPGEQWIEALPVGNGRLGAMIYGRTGRELIPLNEDTIWTGGPYEPSAPLRAAELPDVRKLVFEGKYRKAQELLGRVFETEPRSHQKYQPLGTLKIDFPGHEEFRDYRRELDLDTAIAGVTYRTGAVRYSREVFASPVDQVIVVRLTADQPGKISFSASLLGAANIPPGDETFAVEPSGSDGLLLKGRTASSRGVKGRLEYRALLKARPEGGRIAVAAGGLTVTGANAVTLLIPAATNFLNYKDLGADPAARIAAALAGALKKSYAELRRDHVAEHQRLFRRVRLDLAKTPASELPTDERLQRFPEGGDPQLAALYFQFGRYLLMSCSRPGTQPANLQGIWNDKMNPSWDSKFTTNINLQMNYWPAEAANLAECAEPLFAMIAGLAETGSRTARLHYGAGGWVHHFNTDIWLPTAPMGGPLFSSWHTAGAWLCTHLWEHYQFGGDKEFLKKYYPVMKGAAQFFLDTLVEHPQYGWLVTNPSHSPENFPRIPGNRSPNQSDSTSIAAGATVDMQIIRDLFDDCLAASRILGEDAEFAAKVRDARRRLAATQIGRFGQLQEWLEDWDDPDDTHRHLSHLYGLFPSQQITLRATPLLAQAAKVSLLGRGELAMGFSRAWKMGLWARLEDGERAYTMLTRQLSLETKEELQHGDDGEWRGGIYPNMFSCAPPLQVDGVFSGCAGIAEMLLQSTNGEVHLLPALPAAWSSGSFAGLRARDGFEVDAVWRDGKLVRAAVRSRLGAKCRLRSVGPLIVLLDGRPVPAGHPTELLPYGLKKGTVRPTTITEFETKPGREYVLSLSSSK